MKKIASLLIAILAVSGSIAIGRTVKTTRKLPHKAAVCSHPNCNHLDTIIPASGDVTLSGYDKPLRSSKETVFITNNGDYDIAEIVLTTQYLDLKGRELHKRANRLKVEIPAKSTRKADFPSWDVQQSFYYKDSRRPRCSATPYTIKQHVDTIFTYHQE